METQPHAGGLSPGGSLFVNITILFFRLNRSKNEAMGKSYYFNVNFDQNPKNKQTKQTKTKTKNKQKQKTKKKTGVEVRLLGKARSSWFFKTSD